MKAIEGCTKGIHGYRPELGRRMFTDAAMGRQRTGTAMGGMKTAAIATTKKSGKARKGK